MICQFLFNPAVLKNKSQPVNKMTEGFCQESRIKQQLSHGYFLHKLRCALGEGWVSFYQRQAILLVKTKWGRQEKGRERRRGRRREGGGKGQEKRGRGAAETGERQLSCNLSPRLEGGVKSNSLEFGPDCIFSRSHWTLCPFCSEKHPT